jgi:TolB protein
MNSNRGSTFIGRRAAIAALLALLVSGSAWARDATISIAIPGFVAGSADELDKARELARAIASDLRGSGKFRLLDEGNASEMVADGVPAFDRWRSLKAQSVVTGQLSLQPDGRLKIEFRLWDVASGRQLQGAQYFVTADKWSVIPHLIADAIHENLTGQAVRFEDK